MALLQDDKVDWQCRALSALAPIGRLDFLRRHIVTDQILRIILEKCKSKNEKVRNCSARVLSCLLDHQDVEQDNVVVQLKIDLKDAVESLLRSKHDLARAAGASIVTVLVKHGTAPPYVLAGKDLTDKVVPWVAKALEADDLTSFSRVTQLLKAFSHHGRLEDIMSVSHRVSPSSVVSAIVRWFDWDVSKAFSVATAALFTMVQPSDVSPDAIRDAIRNSVWRSNALQMLIMKALKSPDDWIVYYAVIALQLFVDDDPSREYMLQAYESHVFPAIRKILNQVTIGEIDDSDSRRHA
ncbi:hypothetical protein PILCRDRAFT_734800 [Piloderma croceum F 1598]|uniref:Condensin complex subunit 1 C-terminal domain-containing protein n=1 Tax=Piloderma croceum (strain F 1598) TaxID=765440 RepID=A0A0C3AGP8_PILCF|nr:hypothetical protein PILCRDRAFT_734800 [Piloderma croceum F 1598]